MERYFNSLKNELVYHYHFHNDDELDNAINNYAYLFYNHKRPHTYNNGLTPFEQDSKKFINVTKMLDHNIVFAFIKSIS